MFMVIIRTNNDDQRNSFVVSEAQERRRLSKRLYEHEVELPTLSALIIVQCSNMFCKQSRQMLELPGTAFLVNRNKVFLRKAPFNGLTEKLVPTSWIARQL